MNKEFREGAPPPFQNQPLKLFRIFLWFASFPLSLLVLIPACWGLMSVGLEILFWPSIVILPFAVCFGIGLLEGLLDPSSAKREGRPENWLSDALVFAVIQYFCSPIFFLLLAYLLFLLGGNL